MFCHPAFTAAEIRTDPQRETLLTEQHIPAVVGAHGNDCVIVRKMRDVTAIGVHVQHAMQAAIEIVAVAKLFVGYPAHSRHDPHAQHHVEGIGQLDADLGERRAGRSHEVGDDVHRATAHGSVAKLV